jgi:aspartyl-tRNA(Asn)/glutamyl-tRNA(Gln) amidotransferase subunit C
MQITNATIDKLASLSKLSFTETEKVDIKKDLENMLGFIDKINELDLSNEEPLIHLTVGNVNSSREDKTSAMLSNNDALKNSKQKAEPYFIVPKVIKK